MIPPPPPGGKPVAFMDSESFPNYWLLKIRVQHGPVFSFPLRSGESFDPETIRRIEQLCAIFTLVSFNGNYYDVPILSAALCGFSCEQLKWLSDEIIQNNRKPWELGGACEWKPADHIDILEVLPGGGSQKQYAGRIHCKTMRDLPFEPNRWLSESEISTVDSYCENDLWVLEDLYSAASAMLNLRERMSARYGVDLRSKSDAQLGESVIKIRCERMLGERIYKPEIDWNLKFRYEPPDFLFFQTEGLRQAFELVKQSIFVLGPSGRVEMPSQLEGLTISLGASTYKIGIGGLHSTEKKRTLISDDSNVLREGDVRGYYPNLIFNSGKFPPALGSAFRQVYGDLINERSAAKTRQQQLEEAGDTTSAEFIQCRNDNENGKVATNGPFGKTGSPFSILFAPEMLIQTTLTGQLSILMLIEAHELNEIPVVSANTDGFLIFCPRAKVKLSQWLIKQWEQITGLEMETSEYAAIYTQSVNSYLAVKPNGKTKRIGIFAQASLLKKHDPDVEICGDAISDFLSKGTPMLYTIAACRDIRKFITMQKVAGGAVKLWGEGPRDVLVRDMTATLQANGWTKAGRKWAKAETVTDATTAYKSCFQPQTPEYLAKVIRWYYGMNSPGPIVYNNSGNLVSLSYGAQPCMTLPDEFPADVDYGWYMRNCEKILADVGFFEAFCERCFARKKFGICQNYGCESQ